jgi:hypothetical protein
VEPKVNSARRAFFRDLLARHNMGHRHAPIPAGAPAARATPGSSTLCGNDASQRCIASVHRQRAGLKAVITPAPRSVTLIGGGHVVQRR